MCFDEQLVYASALDVLLTQTFGVAFGERINLV
jgi:hypothetical protein